MAGMIINVRLNAYLIAFLEKEFGGQPFEFPKGHLFNRSLYFLLQKPPAGWRPKNYGRENAQVAVPFLEEKDPSVYFYLSDRKQLIFRDRVRDLFMSKFHGYILAAHASGIMSRNDIVEAFAEEAGLCHVQSVYDLLEKDYKRFLDATRIRSKRRKNFLE
jgi:hypothetical protein